MPAHLGDFLSPELMHMPDTARRLIDQHVNHHGDCAGCGSAWPCAQAEAAETALGAV